MFFTLILLRINAEKTLGYITLVNYSKRDKHVEITHGSYERSYKLSIFYYTSFQSSLNCLLTNNIRTIDKIASRYKNISDI